MTCAHCWAIESRFDSRVAQRDLDSYRRKGPSASSRQLLRAARQAGIRGASVLDVGGGVGAIAHELIAAGATNATIVDASSAYLAAARSEADRRGVGARLQLMNGDFTAIAERVPAADVVTLDKVVCCYPDMDRLLADATNHARRLLGIVYPRDTLWVRFFATLHNALRAVQRNAFRIYIFRNAAIDTAIRRTGLAPRFERRSLIWVIALYERVRGST